MKEDKNETRIDGIDMSENDFDSRLQDSIDRELDLIYWGMDGDD